MYAISSILTATIDLIFHIQCLKLSAFAAQTLIDAGAIRMNSLDAHSMFVYQWVCLYFNVPHSRT